MKSELLYIGNLLRDTVSKAYLTKISIDELIILYVQWVGDGDKILIDEAGGFIAYCMT